MTALERMEARRVVDVDGCWVWPGRLSKGYGRITDRGRTYLLHVYAYEQYKGPVPAGLEVDHDCHSRDLTCGGGECKHRACWNPEHLVARTHRDNTLGGRAPGEMTLRTGVCQRDHLLTDDNVIVRTRPSGTAHRACRTCLNESQRARYARKG